MNGYPLIKNLMADHIRKHSQDLSAWFNRKLTDLPVPFYSSVDVRDAGFKVATVDHNLYPAGFNNVCSQDRSAAPAVLKRHLASLAAELDLSSITKIVLLPEAHTKNAYYAENLKYLMEIFANADVEIRLGWYVKGVNGPVELEAADGSTLTAHPIEIRGGEISAGGFVPDIVLLNNDFSGGYPEELDEVKQPILPSHVLGWHSRKKCEHFKYYNELAAEFAGVIGIDPWLIQVDTVGVDPVNFNENTGLEAVTDAVDQVLTRTRKAYADHSIESKPFVFIKNNSGTYGMGIMTAYSVDDLKDLNRRARNKMSVGKGSSAITSVIVQEGIPTSTLYEGKAAEPVIYLFGSELMGGFLRSHTKKGAEDNLNSPGAVFQKLCMSDLQELMEDAVYGPRAGRDSVDADEFLLELVYGSIARIAVLATGRELQRHLAE